MSELRNVLVVGPRPAYSWKSISNYTEAVASMSGLDGVGIESVAASWWTPPGVRTLLDWRRGHEPLTIADARRSDVVHITDQGLGHLVPTFEGMPTVVTCHDVMPFVVPGFYGNPVAALAGHELLRAPIAGMLKASRIVAVSGATAADLRDRFSVDGDRICVVPVPINPAFRPIADARTQLADEGTRLPDGPLVLSVGATARHKNLEFLLSVLADPAARHLTLVRVGPALTGAQRRLAVRLGVAPRIVELGNLPLPGLVRVYNASDVLAQPSLYEGFGMPVAEAMSCGLPVVCSDRGALPEVAGEAAMVVPVGEPGEADARRAWGEALAVAASDSDIRSRMRAEGAARARDFAPECVVRQLFDVYRSAAG